MPEASPDSKQVQQLLSLYSEDLFSKLINIINKHTYKLGYMIQAQTETEVQAPKNRMPTFPALIYS